ATPQAKAPTSDFEIQSDAFDPGPTPTAEPTRLGPAWLQLGGEPDDVAFPVLDQRPSPAQSSPVQGEPPATSAWTWNDEEDLEEEDEPEDEDEPGDQAEVLDEPPTASRELLDLDELTVPSVHGREAYSASRASHVALPVVPSRDWDEDRPAVETATDHPAGFTLARSGPMTVEELDLAPMVDVAFQLVLFFMVTATTVLYKTLEIPKPTADPPPGAVAQGHSRSLDDFKDDYVIVEIDATGAMKIDHEPVPAEFTALAERLRTAREKTNRKTMLLSADFATPHRHSVLAYDAANEIGMGIAIAKPKAPQGPGPTLVPGGVPPRAGPAPRTGASAK
ncbi:MAG TPA: biopolymer transporter ExbD, partial [Isosphaeraceae bacterium]|nr:biopolymer transporter ExbD [Isosphaeraceae bacterium]